MILKSSWGAGSVIVKSEEERRQTVTPKWMEEMFGDKDPEDMRSWMEGMGSMMERHCCATGSGLARWMLKR